MGDARNLRGNATASATPFRSSISTVIVLATEVGDEVYFRRVAPHFRRDTR